MKIKTFILTFLMMMSSPFLFGQQTGANYDWGDAPYSQNKAMMSAKLNLDGVTDYSIYEIGAFCGNEIRGKQRANSTGDFFLSIMLQESSEEISFRLYNHEADLEIFNVYKTTTLSDNAHIGGPGNSVDVSATYVAKIGNAAYPTIEKAIAAAQEGETVTILAGNYTQTLNINKAITVQGERNDQNENLVNITGKLNITANNATAKNLNVNNGNGNGAYINANDVTVDGCKVVGGNGFRNCYTTGTVTFKNSIITGSTYGIHFDGSAGGNIVIEKCDITGWTSFASTITNVAITDTDFLNGNYNVLRFYQDATVTGVTFPAGMRIDTGNGGTGMEGIEVKFNGCSIEEGGNLEDAFPGSVIAKSKIYVDDVLLKREAKIGNTYYETLAEAIAAVGDGDVVIELLADVTFDYNARDAYGTTGTTSLTINGNGKTLTLNQKDSDWASFGLANAVAKVVFNNMTIEKTGYGDTSGAWNTHAIIFSSEVEMNDVIVNNSMAVQDGATLNDVTINEANGYYGLWINGNGQSVTMTGGSITATNGGRGIKIADQYVGAPALVTLSVTGTTFNTAKKAAVLVSSTAGAAIAASNVDITNVAEDKVNFAWVDEDWAAHYGKVTVTGGTLGQESMPSFVAALMNGEKVDGYYKTLPEAITAQTGSEIVKVLKDATGAGAKINKDITIDFNEKTYTFNEGVGSGDLTSNGFQLLGGNVVLKNGTLKVADADASEFYILVQNYTNLKVENMTLDGTNLDKWSKVENNWDSYTLSNNSGEVNIINTKIYANDEGVKAFAFDVDNNANYTSKPVVNVSGENTLVRGNVEVDLPNNLNISGGTFTVEIEEAWCADGFIPEDNGNGTWTVKEGQYVARIGETGYETVDAAFAAAQNGNEVKILAAGTYKVPTGKNITITGEVENVKFDMSYAVGIYSSMTFNNVTFEYGNANYKGLQHAGTMVYNNCTINGQVFLYGTSETFNNCTFNQNSADAYNVWTYGAKEVVFNECTFNSAGKSVLIYSEQSDLVNNVTVTDCDFIASAPVYGKAAIEMDSSLTAGINLTIDGATTTGFGSGNVSGNSLWNNKKDNETEANNDIKVVVNNETVLAPLPLVAMTADDKNHRFTSLQAAVNAADATNNTITLINNVQLNAYVTINKSVTLDLGEYNITRENGTALYVNGESIEVTIDGEGTVSGTQAVYVDNGIVAIDGGNYVGNFEAVYVKGTGHVVINDGTFSGENENKTFILNKFDGDRATTDITVKGGTFVGFNPQNNAAEGANTDFCDANYAATETETGVWAVLPAVAKIGETRFATLQDAVNAADATNNTITLIKDVQLDAYVTINKSVTLNLGQFNITRVDGTALYFNGEGIEVTIDGEGTVSGTQAVYVDKGTVTIDGGNYVGHHAVYVINNGHAVIYDGTFKLKEGADPNFLLNEYDATRDVTTIAVKGGTFVGFNPQNNAAEGANTNFCAEGYAATETETGVWAVLPVVAKIGEATYATVQDAINVATATDVIDVVGSTTEENITIADNADITLTFAENVTLNGYFAPFNGNLTINGGTINNTNSGASAIEINAGELNLNNVNIASARHAVRIDGAVTATINGGEYTLTATSGTRHAVNVSGGAEVTIKAGTFVGPKGTTMDSGSAVNVQSGATVTIEGGNYSGGKNNTLASAGTLVVTGGTFDQDPSAYVTTPYVVIKKSDNEYNVIKGVAKIGETYYASLQEAIGNVKNGETINLLVACAENVSIDQTEGVSFTIDGQIAENTKVQYTGTISIDGNGGYDRAETLTIKNINFYNNILNSGITFIDAKTETQSHNVTIESCVFDGNGNTLAKGIQVSEGNNWTVKGCTVNNNYNIFIDYAGAYNKMMNNNLLVDGCTINAKQGVLLGRFSNNCTIQNTSFNCATLGINVASRVGTTEGEVLSHTLNNVNFTGKAINCSYTPSAPAHTHIFNIVGEVTSASELSFPDLTNAGGRLNFVLTATDATLQAKGQDYLTVNVSEELAAQHYKVVYDVDTYKAVKEKNVKNITKDGEPTYPTLAEAITAASAGDELVLLNNITEDVTISKNLTIDGGDKNYTGTMTGNSGLTVTVQNLNFVNAGFVKNTTSTIGKYTFTKCTFDGEGTYAYPLSFRGANILKVEDCSVQNYLYSFLYIRSGTNTVDVKNVTVENCPSYGVYFASGVNSANIENLTVKNSNNGFVINNTADRTFNLKGCKLENVTTAINHANGTNTVKCNLSGENDFGTSALSQYATIVLEEANATLKAPEGYTVNVTTELYNQGYVVEYNENEGVYSVVPGNVWNKTANKKYATLTDAINAATAGDDIVLLADITEDVTVNTSLTIDGKAEGATANSTYTGKMTVKADLTIKNVNFDGKGYNDYAVETRGASYLTVEDCTAKNYGYGFIQLASGTALTTVKNVTVSNMNYGVKVDYSNAVVLENVDIDCAVAAVLNSNYGEKTITIKNSNLSILGTWTRNNTIKTTYVFEGENTVGQFIIDAAIDNFKLADVNSTLAAPNEITVTTDMEGYVVEYNEGVYSVVAGNVLNSTTGKKYATLQAAIDAAESGDVIVILKDINLNETALEIIDNAYDTYFIVEGKSVTIDLNGMKISGVYAGTNTMLVGVFSTDNNGHITLEDSSDEKTGAVNVTTAEGYTVYSLIANYEPGCSITINGGTYTLDKASDSHIYSGSTNDETQGEGVTVNGGVFKLGNVGSGENGKPWMFNVLGGNNGNVVVKGGTFDADINHQFWANEVYVPETKALQNNGDGTWTVGESVAYVEEIATSTNAYSRKVGYATLAEAVNPLGNPVDNTVTVNKAHKITSTAVVERDITIDFGGLEVTSSASPAFRIQKDANVIVMNGNMNTENYNFILGASDATSAGNLTIESGNYKGASSVVSVTNGLLTINGGEFEANESEWGSQYLINCIDRYNINGSGIALVSITGGKFHAFNPEDNTAENPQVNFCAQGYGAVETAAGSNIWEVMPVHTHDFYTGWRWYSTYIDINGSEGLIKLEDALEDKGLSINHNVDGFVTYEDGMWWNELATLKETNVKNMYKIEVSGDLEMKLIGNVVDFNEAIEIKTGYNWIGYPFTKAVNLNEAFAETFEPAEGDYMISQFQFAFYYNGSWNGSLVSLNPGEGYIYERVDDDTELKYNVNNINRNVVKTNISTEDNKWTPNARMYPNNMTMIAVVDGAMGDNYEVAAFVNGEVRGSARPIYIEALDAYMMFLTIHGDEVEEMSFMYYDLTTGESYMLNDRFDYTNDAHLGSVKEPYVFSRGTTGIGDAAMSQVNIYPNPTTTGTEINLEAVCDTVEVFNALGVKVAEYQNVDSIDALETAGIYVIRITNDGNVQNCRLVVK